MVGDNDCTLFLTDNPVPVCQDNSEFCKGIDRELCNQQKEIRDECMLTCGVCVECTDTGNCVGLTPMTCKISEIFQTTCKKTCGFCTAILGKTIT